MVEYNRALGVKHGNFCANHMIKKTILIIINPLTWFGSLLSHPQRQYEITKKFFL